MQLLLDTHAALWWAQDPAALAPDALGAVNDPENVVWISAASVWELAIKVRKGTLTLDVSAFVDDVLAAGARLLGIGADDALRAGALDWNHRDPFDRMLVAQAERLDLTLVTRDAAMLRRADATTVA